MRVPPVPPPRRPRARRLVSLLAATLLTAGVSAAAAYTPSAAADPARPDARKAVVALQPVRVEGAWRSTGPSGEQSARVQCPAGYYATGGGADTDGGSPHLSTSIAVPQQTDTADGWSVTARNYSTQGGMRIRAYVVCDQAAHFVRQTTTYGVPKSSVGDAVATCPGGTTASGGGYMAIGIGLGDQSVFLIQDSGPIGNYGWRAEGYNHAPDDGFITAQVICSTQPHVVRLGEAYRTPHNYIGSSVATCSSATNEVPTGGGQFVGAQVYAEESIPTPWGWNVAALNTSGSPQDVAAVVICRPLG
ncbi:hypothetical protein [Streptomyces sp.]|uniref:hypothetical protein n=1 Tax=Streptomyces sp. TaxID=1931 RepID=UPI002F92B615